ncbi:GNAT family N-acetyltransferase [Lentibacillus sp. N15]|uniref:GNAT family N-acetyltransferase n=1 Tax=Lentibacillus songyuanensis TaxID=3136161 RepID=UPI0031BACB05
MEAIIHKQFDILEKTLPKWEILKEEFHDITIFQDIEWIKSWWKYKNKNKIYTPYIVQIKKGSRTIGIIPFYISNKKFINVTFKVLIPLGAKHSDYLIPMLSKKYSAKKQLEKGFEKIYSDRKNWDCIDWGNIPKGSVFDSMLNSRIAYDSKIEKKEGFYICPYLFLGKDAEETTRKFDKKLVKEILKKEKKLKRNGQLAFRKVQEEFEIEPIMNAFFELHCIRNENTNSLSRFRFKEDREYVLNIAKILFKKNLLHLTYLSHNNEIAAVEFAMADEEKIYLYLTTFNMKYKKYSVGNILLYKVILDACGQGYEIVDFMRGAESYKKQWGTIKKFNVRYVFFNSTMRSLLYKMISRSYYSQKFYEKSNAEQFLTKSIIRVAAFIWGIPNMFKGFFNPVK